MPTVERSLVIQADRAALFELTQDYGRRLGWDPFLKEARLLGGATNAVVGVRAWCVAWHGLGMETEYVAVKPPAVAAVKMTRGPAILEAFAGSWRFVEHGPAATRVTFRYHFKVRPRRLRWLVEPVLGLVFTRDARLRLDAAPSGPPRARPSAEGRSPLWTPRRPFRKLSPIAGRRAAVREAFSPRPRRFPTGTQSHE